MSAGVASTSPAKALVRGHLTVTLPLLALIVAVAGAGGLVAGPSGAVAGGVLAACILAWPIWMWSVGRWRRWAAQHGCAGPGLDRLAVITGLVGPAGSAMARAEATLNVPLLWFFTAGALSFVAALVVLDGRGSRTIAIAAAVVGCLSTAVGGVLSIRAANRNLARITVLTGLSAAAAFLLLSRISLSASVAAGVATFLTVLAFCLLALLIWLPDVSPIRSKLARRGGAVVVAVALAASLWSMSGAVPGLTREPTSASMQPATWVSYTTGSSLPSTTLADGLKITDVETGTGAVVRSGDSLVVRYILWDDRGRQIDSSDSQGGSFKFTIGTGTVIQGWDEGLIGMRVRGLRRLAIPPALAYGSSGATDPSGRYVIPPNATLVFIVGLIADSSAS